MIPQKFIRTAKWAFALSLLITVTAIAQKFAPEVLRGGSDQQVEMVGVPAVVTNRPLPAPHAPTQVGTDQGVESEPNNTFATADVLAGTAGRIRGALLSGGAPATAGTDEDWYSFTTTVAASKIYAGTVANISGQGTAGGSGDTVLEVFATDGTTVLEEDDEDGQVGGGNSSSIAGTTLGAPGTYYLRVTNFSTSAPIAPYDLYFAIRDATAPTAETEPNNNGTPQVMPVSQYVSGVIDPVGDTDTFTFTLAAGDTVFISQDLDPERDVTTFNGRVGLGLLGTPPNFLVTGDSGAFDTIDSEAFYMTVETAGTYQVYVDAQTAGQGGPTATYNYNVTIIPAVPAGTCTTYTNAVATPLADLALTTSTISIPDSRIIRSLRVVADITHPNILDLDVHLRSPANNDNGLFTDAGVATQTGAQNINLSEQAALPLIFTVLNGPIFKAEVSYRLDWFRGENSLGTWALDLRDDLTANTGTLNNWSLEVCEEAPLAGTAVYTEDFEASNGGYTQGPGVTANEWEYGTPATVATTTVAPFLNCASGTGCWKTDLDNTYDLSSIQDLTSPPIPLVGVSGPVTLYWQSRYQMESISFDRAWVRVTEVANPTHTRIVWNTENATMTSNVGNPLVTIPASAGWGRYSGDISDFAGQIIQVTFHLESDSSVNFAGWAIDDVSIRGTGGASPTPTPTVTATATASPTVTATASPTVTATASPTVTATVSPPASASPSATCVPAVFSYTGPPVAIPDSNTTGVNLIVAVAGAGTISDLDFRFDGTVASPDPLSTTVGVNHSWVGDMIFRLTSPGGTTVTFYDRPGVPASTFGCSSNNLFALTIDDEAGSALEGQCPGGTDAGPLTGTFSGNNPLSAFDGQNPNGNWTLTAIDAAGGDTGTVRAFSLIFGGACGTPPPASATPSASVSIPPGTPSPSPTGSPCPTVVLVDQTDNASANGTSSQNFEAAFDTFDNQTADDFVVPAGETWNINQVNARGSYFNGTGPAISFNVFFYTNAGTLPAVVETYSATNLAYVDTAGTFTIPLTTPAVLTAGTYWVSVQCNMDFGVGGQWAWTDRTVQTLSGAAFRNPGGGFACPGGNSWVVKTSCVATTAPDQLFQLLGSNGSGCPSPSPSSTIPPGTPTPSPSASCAPVTVSYTGAPVAIPDNNTTGVNLVVAVAGVGTISDLDFRFDGTVASPDPLSTTVGVNHSWVGDMIFRLTSPGGTTVTFYDRPGVPASTFGCSSNNLFALTIDDEAGSALEGQCPGDTDAGPLTGTFSGNNPLAAFDGQNPNGNWTLTAIDAAGGDVGTVRAFSLIFGGACGTPPPASPSPSAGTPTPSPSCPPVITHSSSQAITPLNSVSCNNASGHTDNSYWRAFNMGTFVGGAEYNVSSVSFGVEEATGAGGTQPVTVRLYTNAGGAFPAGTRTQIATTTVQVLDSASGTVLSVPIVANVPAGTSELVMEVFTPNGQATGNFFFIGSNTAAETGPSYLSAADCGIATPTDTATIGFPDMNIVFNVLGTCVIATPTPSPSVSPSPSLSPSPTATISPTITPGTPSPSPSPSASATASPSPASKAINLSTRMRVETGDRVGIGGFIITGSTPKEVIIRAIGPSLTRYDIVDVLADPVLELHSSDGGGDGALGFPIINNNWRDTQEAEIQATGIPPTNDLESAIVATLDPGAYTAIVRGNGNTSGVALVEVYDLNQGVDSKLANLATRAFVSIGDNIVIAGFLLSDNSTINGLGGPNDDRVIVRGIGPSLAPAVLPAGAVLADPTLELRDTNGTLIVSNNDWQDNAAQAAEITAAGLAPANSLEAAIAATLPPGLYTALLAGRNNGTGIGVVEIYDRGPEAPPAP